MSRFTEYLRELGATLSIAKEKQMVDFGPIPPEKEVQDTMDGVSQILDIHRGMLLRQIASRGLKMNKVDLAGLEVDLYKTLLDKVLEHAGCIPDKFTRTTSL